MHNYRLGFYLTTIPCLCYILSWLSLPAFMSVTSSHEVKASCNSQPSISGLPNGEIHRCNASSWRSQRYFSVTSKGARWRFYTRRALGHVTPVGLKSTGNYNVLNTGYAADGYARVCARRTYCWDAGEEISKFRVVHHSLGDGGRGSLWRWQSMSRSSRLVLLTQKLRRRWLIRLCKSA